MASAGCDPRNRRTPGGQKTSRFAVPGVAGEHPVHDTVSKRYRHLNFF
jgi:hypothetical protein